MIPSSFEGFPLAGLEAAAAGVPVVACNVAGAEEFIRASASGVVFPEGDVEQAAEKVLQAFASRKHYSERGREFAATCSSARYMSQLKSEFKMAQS